MSYQSFTLPRVVAAFSLTIRQAADDFAGIAPAEPSDWLRTTLRYQTPLVMGKTSEKGRSEFLVAPILVEVREKKEGRIALFSGVKFDVDRKAGLYGYCDNEGAGKPLETVYGAVTDGTRWRFLRLVGKDVSLDLREYTLTELPQILGILAHMVS